MGFENTVSERVGKLRKIPNSILYTFQVEIPLELKYTNKLVNYLSKASNSLGKLSEAGSKMSNPNLMIVPYLKNEAVLSSRIEGTKTTLSEVFKGELEDKRKLDEDHKEVLNYISTLHFGLKHIEEGKPIDEFLIKTMHTKLLQGVRGEMKAPGRYKDSINWIGGTSLDNATYVPAHPDTVESLMKDLMTFLQDNGVYDDLLKIGLVHYWFEAIHPFSDGNGRLGRLLIILDLCQRGLLSQPLLYLSAYFEKNRSEYYTRLERVSSHGEMEEWLEFFLRGINVQSNEVLLKTNEMQNLKQEYRLLLTEEFQTNTPLHIMDTLFENPFFTKKKLVEKLGGDYNTISDNVNKLEKIGLVEKDRKKSRSVVYKAVRIADILEIN